MTQTSGSKSPTQIPSASQIPAASGSHTPYLHQILGATISLGSISGVGFIMLIIWLYKRLKHRQQTFANPPEPDLPEPEFTVDPFPVGCATEAHPSQLMSNKLTLTPEPIHQSSIITSGAAINITVPETLPLDVPPASDRPR
ncbi:hypothetical protein V5O48_014860, partial [Marasmius crinis-equi]